MTILDRIVADTRALVKQRSRTIPPSVLEEHIAAAPPPRSLASALQSQDLTILAELKKASPSKGIIRESFDVVDLARQYETYGADAISVLTEPMHFLGSLDNLRRARQSVALPLLRKDFIIDAYQVLEARANGADAVLLIAAILDRHHLYDLHQAADALGLSCLVEVYEREEMDKLDFTQIRILGVNNRDLHTFAVDINHSLRLFAEAPAHVVRVSESGLRSAEALVHLRRNGVDAVLIGETFMRAPHPGQALARLKEKVQSLLEPTP